MTDSVEPFEHVLVSRDTAEWFQLIVETIPGVAYVAEPGELGTWLYVSPRLRDVLGYDPTYWIAEPDLWAELIHPDDRDRVLSDETLWTEIADGVHVSEYRLRAADGTYRWIRDAATARSETELGAGGLWFGVLLDVSATRDAQEALTRSESLLRSVLETAQDAFVAIDGSGRVLEWNRRAESMFGRLRAEALGSALNDLILPVARRASNPFTLQQRGGTAPSVADSMVEMTAMRADGSEFLTEVTVWLTRIGESSRVNAFIRDITERRQLQDELHALAFSDPLTGLANRTSFCERLDAALDGRGTSAGPLVVMFLDVDDFKSVNDTLGHAAGDQLLLVIAERLRGCVRPGDVVSRIAGDEFAILLPEVASVADAVGVAERVGRALRAPVMLEGRRSVVSASIGLASSTLERPLFGEALLREADAAMYEAKRAGKNAFVVFAPDMHALAFARLELRADLALAFGQGEFHLDFQPYFELVDGQLSGFEALIRWNHPVRGLIPPCEFIPLAESSGLIYEIGDWVLREACLQAATWPTSAGLPAPTLNVNMSPLQIQEAGLVEAVQAALDASALDPCRLVLEITESLLVRRSDETVASLGRLRALGIRIAIDDFGTGYSSLSYLHNLPVDILKIDKSFTDQLRLEGEGSSVANLIVQIGRTLDMHVIAEGVEHPEQVEALIALGCQSAQGFYLGRPMSAADSGTLCASTQPVVAPLPPSIAAA